MDKEQVVNFWKMLRHQEETELRAIIPKQETYNFHFSTEQELLKWITRYEGTHNLYLGVNERRKGGTKAEDVLRVKVIPVDIDCIIKPASKEDLEEAQRVMSQIVSDGYTQGFKQPYVSFSGNGYQIFFCIPPIELNQNNYLEVDAKIQEFERALQRKYNSEKIKLDNVGDLPRIMRIPSTFNIKSKTNSYPIFQTVEEDEKLRDFILNIQITSSSKVFGGTLPAELKQKIDNDTDIKSLMDGDLLGTASRSEAEMKLVCKLISLGLTKDEIYSAMSLCKLGKWQEQGTQYRELTYRKAITIATVPKREIRELVDVQMTELMKDASEGERIKELQFNIKALLAKNQIPAKRQATEMLTQWIENKEHIATIRSDDKKEMWIYKEGIYVSDGQSWIKEICRAILKEDYTSSFMTEVLEKIEADTFVDKTKFFNDRGDNIYWMPVQNGILHVLNRELQPHTPDKVFFTKIPIVYDPEAKCPAIDKFFDEVLENPDLDRKVMDELFGYALLKDHRIEKAFMFLGSGRNGKGRTLELLRKYVGEGNFVGVHLQEMESDNYALAQFFGKLLNIVGDLSAKALEHSRRFKELTGMDAISANRKFKNHLTFESYTKHIFSANQLPRTYDLTPAFFSRWVVLQYPHTFMSQKEFDAITDAEEKKKYRLADKEVIQKITTPNELSGMLNKALIALSRLIEQKDFSYSQTLADTKSFWMRKSSSLRAFIEDCMELDETATITKKKFREAYTLYARTFQLQPAGDKEVKEVLTREYAVSEDRIMNNQSFGAFSQKIYVWEGIQLKSDWKEIIKTELEEKK